MALGPQARHVSLSRIPRTTDLMEASMHPDTPTTVHFEGGPWHDTAAPIDVVTAPVYSAGDEVGRNYWLDTTSNPPTYHWRTEA
jgi:hypothetical protein